MYVGGCDPLVSLSYPKQGDYIGELNYFWALPKDVRTALSVLLICKFSSLRQSNSVEKTGVHLDSRIINYSVCETVSDSVDSQVKVDYFGWVGC